MRESNWAGNVTAQFIINKSYQLLFYCRWIKKHLQIHWVKMQSAAGEAEESAALVWENSLNLIDDHNHVSIHFIKKYYESLLVR